MSVILCPPSPGADPVPDGFCSLARMAREGQDDAFDALLVLLLGTTIGRGVPGGSAPDMGSAPVDTGPARREPARSYAVTEVAPWLPCQPAAQAPDPGVWPQPPIESHDPATAAATTAPTAALVAEAGRAAECLSVSLGPGRASPSPPSLPPELQNRLEPNGTRGAAVAVPELTASDARAPLVTELVAPASSVSADAARGDGPADVDWAAPSRMTDGRSGPAPSAANGARAILAPPNPPSPPADGALPLPRPVAIGRPDVVEEGRQPAAGRPAEALPDAGASTDVAPEPPDLSAPIRVDLATVSASAPAGASEAASVPPDARVAIPVERIPRQIVAHVRLALEDGSRQVEMQLHPPHLGRVGVTVSVQGHDVSLNLTTDNLAAQQLLTGRLPELALALSEAGMSLLQAKVSVNDQGRGRQGAPHGSSRIPIERAEAAPVESSMARWQSSSLHALDVSA